MSDNNEAQINVQRLIADAVEDARDSALEHERLESVRRILLTNREARLAYLEFNTLNHLLASESFLPALSAVRSARSESQSPRRRRFSIAAMVSGAAVALVLLARTILFQIDDPPNEQPLVIASLKEINGNVTVTSGGAEARLIQSDVNIKSGDTIRTSGASSSAVLSYPDATRLLIVGNTSLTCADAGQKGLVLHGGALFASVVPQPAGVPMLIATPQDELQVLGTRFSVEATTDQTDVSVNEGRVRLTRLLDGRSVEVPAGQRVVSSVQSELALEEIPVAPAAWSVDFENGLPKGWDHGNFVTEGVPGNSRGGVKATRLADRVHDGYAILSHADWLRGLFSVYADSHISITFKMESPNWINIFLVTRTRDADEPQFANNFQFNEIPFGRVQPGQWYSIDIPLSRFKRLPGYTEQPLEDLLPFTVVINSLAPDRGLVIDEIRIARGGIGSVELKKLD